MRDETKINSAAANSILPFAPGIRLADGEVLHDLICPGFSLRHEVNLMVPVIPVLGHMSVLEMAVFTELARAHRAGHILEFGTFDGLTDRHLLDNIPDLTRLVTVDLPDELHATPGEGLALHIDPVNCEMIGVTKSGWRTEKHPRRNRITTIRKDSGLVTPADLMTASDGIRYDMVLVDGAHTYEYCRHDSQLAMSVVRKGGLVVWHDFNKIKYLPGVTRYLMDLANTREIYWIQGPELDTSLAVTIA